MSAIAVLSAISIIGAWLGSALFGHFGPQLIGISLVPSVLGAGVVLLILSLLSNTCSSRRI